MELGFNVHSYRERYPQVLALAHQDLEIRGFIVDKLDLEQDENGIYIKYSLSLPRTLGKVAVVGGKFALDHLFGIAVSF